MSDPIARVDFRAQYRDLRHEILAAVDRVFASGSLILGREVAAFEEAMVQLLETPGHAVGVGSGTDAIGIALRALGIGPGDEVITVSNTAVGTVSGIQMAGAIPVFCDIDPETLMLDCADARRRITSRTRAIFPVHLFGNAVDMSPVLALAAERQLKVIEDCAQACGTRCDGRAAGTIGDVGCFSFYPTKNLGACGDGGLCFTRSETLAQTMRRMRMYGCDARGHARHAGVNSRLDEVQAAILLVKLRLFGRHLEERRRVARLYDAGLPERCRAVMTTRGVDHSYCLYVVRVPQRSVVLACMAEAGIECGVHYPLPIHRMEAFRRQDYDAVSLPHTERIAHEILSLPCHPDLSDASVNRVLQVLRDAV